MTGTTFSIVALAILLIGITDAAEAQERAVPFARPSVLTARAEKQDSRLITIGPIRTAKDYRWKGALIGGATGVVLGAIAGAVICSQDDTDSGDCPLAVAGVAALTGAPLAILGGIIGANIERPPEP